MFNLFDILQAQNGQNMQTLGQPFGLSPEQSLRAVQALLPALSIGLQRNAADPAGLGRLFGLAGPYASPSSASAQPDLLGQLFGSPAVSQAVLQQAAAASGIGTQALRQMLPMMAGMVVAGIVHMMLNQSQAPTVRPAPEPAKPTFPTDFWKDWMDNFMTAGAGPAADRAPAPGPTKAAPARVETAREAKKPSPKSDTVPDAPASDMPLDMLQQMFQTGAQVQEQNVKAMQDIFDTFWKRAPDEAASNASEPKDATSSKRADSEKPRKSSAKPAGHIG